MKRKLITLTLAGILVFQFPAGIIAEQDDLISVAEVAENSYDDGLLIDSSEDAEGDIFLDDWDEELHSADEDYMIEESFETEADIVIDIEDSEDLFETESLIEAASFGAGIPNDAVCLNDHYYFIYNESSSYADAEMHCRSLGGHLATISSAEENDFIYQYLTGKGLKNAYFGLTDRETEGVWKWVTGEPVTYTNWASGEPNSESSGEDYAMFYKKFTTGQWNDGIFASGDYYICEWEEDPIIVVSLGDSYSSGEGIEPFYGQDKALLDKVKDADWLAHRSQYGWPGQLEIPGVSRSMKDYKYDEGLSYSAQDKCIWYFKASSGAETKHFNTERQQKTVRQNGVYMHMKHDEYLPRQLEIFDEIYGEVDYVTLSVGGNDVGFVDIVKTCVKGSTYLGSTALEEKLDNLWSGFDVTRSNIKQVYKDIKRKTGSGTNIIVAGYPQLFDYNGKGFAISRQEATLVNENVSKFNAAIEEIVQECANDGMKIHFVDVQSEFSGHQAYSNDPWLNDIILGAKNEDLDDKCLASSYSVHPNILGAKAYARCVNAKIREIANAD